MHADPASTIPEYTIVVSEKGGQERREVFRSPELTLGRVQGNDLVLPKGNVSKRHARILYREGRFIVTDLNSTNGTYVNRRRIVQATIVRADDKIYVGDFVIRVELADDSFTPDPLTPSRVPEALLSHAEEQTFSQSILPGWERASTPDDISRPSLGPPPHHLSEPPPAPSPSDSSPSQRFADMAGGHRGAVAQIVAETIAQLGDPEDVPEPEYERSARELVNKVADRLLVEGQVPVGSTLDAIADQALDELLDVGPLAGLLSDPAVSSVTASRFDALVGTRDGRQQILPPGFSNAASFERALRRLCVRAGIQVGDTPVVNCQLAEGVRMSVIHGKVAPDGPLVVLHKPRKIRSSVDDLVRRGAVSRAIATFLAQCVASRLNILVIGPRDEGANVVLSALCAATQHERVIAASDFDDVVGEEQNAVRLDLSSFEGDARRLLEVASGIAQGRLVLTLTGTALAAATLEAIGNGVNGVLASLQSSDAERGLQRLTADVAAARPGVSLEASAGWVLGAFDIVLEVARLRDGRIRVLRIAELERQRGGGIGVRDIFRFTVSRVAAGGAVEGHFLPSGEVPRVASHLQAMGMRIENSLFSRPPSR